MPLMSQGHRHTIFDVMETKGVFSSNPANEGSYNLKTHEPLYQGPVQYPMMFYHPKGEQRCVVPPEVIELPSGRTKELGGQYEIVHRTARTEAEATRLRAAGWHEHPSDAMKQNPKLASKAPPKSADARIAALEAEIRRLKGEQVRIAQAEANDLGVEHLDTSPLPDGPILVKDPTGKAELIQPLTPSQAGIEAEAEPVEEVAQY